MPFTVLPEALTGVRAPIVVLSGRHFPTGSHKVGPAYSILVEKQLEGECAPGEHTLVFPSTGNFGIGGAWVGPRMGYRSLVVLPEEMSEERFEKIRGYGAEVVATPGSESNVKEIYDKVRELRAVPREPHPEPVRGVRQLPLPLPLHRGGGARRSCTRSASRSGAFVSAMGSAGTIAAGEALKRRAHPGARSWRSSPCSARRSTTSASARTASRASATSTSPGSTTCGPPTCSSCIDDQECLEGLQLLQEGTELARPRRASTRALARELGRPLRDQRRVQRAGGDQGRAPLRPRPEAGGGDGRHRRLRPLPVGAAAARAGAGADGRATRPGGGSTIFRGAEARLGPRGHAARCAGAGTTRSTSRGWSSRARPSRSCARRRTRPSGSRTRSGRTRSTAASGSGARELARLRQPASSACAAGAGTARGLDGPCAACGPEGVLEIEFDLARARRTLTPRALRSRPRSAWRYEELLPLPPARARPPPSPGWTPIVDAPRLARVGRACGACSSRTRGATRRRPSRTARAPSAWRGRSRAGRRSWPAPRPATRRRRWRGPPPASACRA